MKLILDHKITDRDSFYAAVNAALGPCGKSLDALWDVLTSQREPVDVAIDPSAMVLALGSQSEALMGLLLDAAREGAVTLRQAAPDYDYILFDLDGTLTDSGPGIMEAVRRSLERMEKPVPDDETLRRFVGPPLSYSYQTYAGLTPEEADEAIEKYREWYNVEGVFVNSVYEGIPQALERLINAGKVLAVATSKPEITAITVLDHFGLRDYFTVIVGATMDGSLSKKNDIVAKALQKGRDLGMKRPLMVGDREYDMVGAKLNGIPAMGVLYGYGSQEELAGNDARFLAPTPKDIADIILAE